MHTDSTSARRGRQTSPDKVAEWASLYRSGVGVTEIARRTGSYRQIVRICLRRAGVMTEVFGGVSRSLTADDLAEMERMYVVERLSAVKIAHRFGISYMSAKSKLIRRGVQLRHGRDASNALPLDESVFDDHESHNALYWAGFLMADGCVTHIREKRQISLGLAICDRGHVEKFKAFVGSGHPVRVRQMKPSQGPRNLIVGTGVATLTFGSRRMADALARYGVVERKTLTARAADFASNSPDFFRGCIDGDGSLGIYRSVRGREFVKLTLCGAEPLMGQFADFVRSHIPNCDATAWRRGRIWIVQIQGNRAIQIVRILYGHGGPSLDRKQAIADEAMARPELANESTWWVVGARKYDYKGAEYTVSQLARLAGLSVNVMSQRIIRGWPTARAVETPSLARGRK